MMGLTIALEKLVRQGYSAVSVVFSMTMPIDIERIARVVHATPSVRADLYAAASEDTRHVYPDSMLLPTLRNRYGDTLCTGMVMPVELH